MDKLRMTDCIMFTATAQEQGPDIHVDYETCLLSAKEQNEHIMVFMVSL